MTVGISLFFSFVCILWKIINFVLLLLRDSLFTASQSVILVNSAFMLLDVEAALFKSVKVS